MSSEGLLMRLLPVIAFTAIMFVVAIKSPALSWGVPLLCIAIILSTLSIVAWVPKHHQR
jgi:hypothetical protein